MLGRNRVVKSPGIFGRSPPSSRNPRRRDHRFQPMLVGANRGGAESLERRLVMSTSSHVSIMAKQAAIKVVDVGNLASGQDSSFAGTLKASHRTISYQFSVGIAEDVQAGLSGLNRRAELQLLGPANQLIATSSSDSVAAKLDPGTYSIEVSSTSRSKTNYQLALSAQAPYVPPAPPASNPTSNPASNPTTNPTSNPTSSPTSNPTSNPQEPTLQEFASKLNSVTTAAIAQFFKDAATLEITQPTLMSKQIDAELISIGTDVKNGNNYQAFADFQTLGTALYVEAEVTVAYGLSSQNALLANSQILSDLVVVGIIKEVNFAFLDYLASNSQSHGTGSTSSVWETALFTPGNSGGVLSQSSAGTLTSYYSGDLTDLDHYFAMMDGSIDESAAQDADIQYMNPSDVSDPVADGDDSDLDDTGMGDFGDDDGDD
jgi:hypothetical protein